MESIDRMQLTRSTNYCRLIIPTHADDIDTGVAKVMCCQYIKAIVDVTTVR